MKNLARLMRAGLVGCVGVVLPGCGAVPLPGLLRPPGGSPAGLSETTVCVVDRSADRGLRTVAALKETGSGELFVREGARRQRFARRYPGTRAGGYAGAEPWFQRGEVIRQYGRRYLRYGPYRVVPAASLTRGADHRGVPVFLDRRDQERPAVLYLPVEPGCIFQPYAAEDRASGG